MKKNVLAMLFASFIVLSCQDDEIIKNESAMQQTDALAGKSTIFPASGTANEEYGKAGPYEVSTTAVVGDCKQLAGIFVPILQGLKIMDHSVKCTKNFPYGFETPIATSVYYPTNIEDISGKLPVVNFVGGILSNNGNYDKMARLWASYGFVVTVSGDFFNSFPEMHVLGAMEASKLNKDTQSPLYDKVNMSKMILAGHSAGGGATILTASISESLLQTIDSDLKIVGALPIEPGPIAVDCTVRVPTLGLTGALDTVVPAITWPNIWQNNLINDVPAWSATANTATHMSPTMKVSHNEFAGITVAWIKYIGYDDADAKSYFVGSNYKLKNDPQFKSNIPFNLLYPKVKRNSKADALN